MISEAILQSFATLIRPMSIRNGFDVANRQTGAKLRGNELHGSLLHGSLDSLELEVTIVSSVPWRTAQLGRPPGMDGGRHA